jgi:NADH dehydrogenase
LQTAQVASQQGKYLGRKLSKLAKQHKILAANGLYDDDDATYDKPFSYLHLGSLAYIGNAVSATALHFFDRNLTRGCLDAFVRRAQAVFDFYGTSVMGGLAAMYAWRSVYWSEQVSMRTRALLMIDWISR